MLILCFCSVSAQSERSSVRRGNRDFRKEKYQDAEIDYKKGLIADSLSNAANYNLGNTYYRMENFAEADKCWNAVADSLGKVKHGSDMYHNMGNSCLAQKNYQGAVEAYKNALRRNPGDMETKANLAYAQKMLQNQQDQQDQDQNQNNDQNQDQNQDQQNQDQNNDQNKDQNNDQNQNNDDKNDDNKDQNQDQNQDQNNDQNQNDPDNGQGQTPPPKISQQDAQQMLQAIQDKEKETQDKVKKEKALMLQSKQKEKNW